jgi:hypothetical protein
LLREGEYLQGWQEYEWRLQRKDLTVQARRFTEPLWDGTPLHGATILSRAEQGFGDALQLVRYVPQLLAFGGEVIIECHPQLVSLFMEIPGVKAVYPFGGELPHFDCQLPMFSLPRVFQTTIATIPQKVPYLNVPPDRRRHWSQSIPSEEWFKVGLVWAGSRQHRNDACRSLSLAALQPLLQIEGISCYSLQLGPAREELSAAAYAGKVVDLTDGIKDFADTAALVEQLDLVISVDTAVAHLAGALGKPVWILLPYASDWRWLRERDDSPWYPTARLFRQASPGGWDEPIGRVVKALAHDTAEFQ